MIGAVPMLLASAESTENRFYSNDFNINGDLSKITRDFNLYYDTPDKWENSLADITSDPSKYMTFANNRLERVHYQTEPKPWEGGNIPYRCMAYYTYKNQTFKDFTLTVDAHFERWGGYYNAITVGSMGDGLKSNGGFTLGFYSYDGSEIPGTPAGTGRLFVYLGAADDVAVNFNDWYVHDCAGRGIYDHKVGQEDYKITLSVFAGLATVKINDTVIFSDYEVGYLDGYVSLVNGLIGGSYYDNLQIEEMKDDGIERNADLIFNIKPMGEYTAISMNADTALKNINVFTDLRFDDKIFGYGGAVFDMLANEGAEITAADGVVSLPLSCTANGKIVTLYFKNPKQSTDFSSFVAANPQITLLNGRPVHASAQLAVAGDYHKDYQLNILDLIRCKKLGAEADSAVTSKNLAALRKVLLGVYETAEISPALLGKSALYLGDSIAYGAGDELGLSWAGRIAQKGITYENVAVSGWAVTPRNERKIANCYTA